MPPSAGAKERSIPRASLHEQVVEQLREMIIEHELPPGSRVDERELCERFGISRTPLREALKVVASEGLVELLPNRSPRVTPITVETVAALFDVMSWLERLAGERAALRATEQDAQRLRALLKQMDRDLERGDRLEYFRRNLALHTALVDIAGNPILSSTYRNLVQHVQRARYLALDMTGHLDRGRTEHHDLVDALAAKDGDRLGRLMMEHSHFTGERIQQTLGAGGRAAEVLASAGA
jgi:DNA-binding GntR family transcriptional regulator